MRCPKCNRKLKQNGWGPPHPEMECKNCNIQYWTTADGPVSEKPKNTPVKKITVEKWELKDGYWKKT